MAGASLALIVALNLEVVSIVPPGILTEPERETTTEGGGGVPADAIHQWIEDAPIDPALAMEEERTTTDPAAEQLPIARFDRQPVQQQPAKPPNVSGGPVDVWQVLSVRLVPADQVGMSGGADDGQSDEAGADEPEPVPDPPLDGPS